MLNELVTWSHAALSTSAEAASALADFANGRPAFDGTSRIPPVIDIALHDTNEHLLF